MKFTTEKRLHEIIRDLPEAAKAEKFLQYGYITLEEALESIAQAIREEKERSAAR